jgi:iron complex transport system substrate-binding protein
MRLVTQLRRTCRSWVLVLLVGFAGPAGARSVVDARGRSVDVPDRIERVMPAGPPAAVLIYTLARRK